MRKRRVVRAKLISVVRDNYTDNLMVYQTVLVAAIVFSCSLLITYIFRASIIDDAYIYLRIAAHLANGQGWSYNGSTPTDAATSPPFTMVLGLLIFLTRNPMLSLLVATSIGYALIGGTIFAFVARKTQNSLLAIVLSILVILWPTLQLDNGLETSLYLGLVLVSLYQALSEHELALGILVGFASVARPEALIIIPLVLILRTYRLHYLALKSSFFAIGVATVWYGFSYVVFGSIIPHTAAIKQLQSLENTGAATGYLEGLLTQIPFRVPIAIIALLGLLLSAIEFIRDRDTFILPVFLYSLAQTLGYSLLHAPSWYLWYYAPAEITVLLLIVSFVVFGFYRIVVRQRLNLALRFRSQQFSKKTQLVFGGIWMYGFIFLFSAGICHLYLADGYLAELRSPYRMSPQYIQVAHWLAEHDRGNGAVALQEIGYLGFYSNVRVLDMNGLLNVYSSEPIAKKHWWWWFETRPLPQFVVVHDPAWPMEPEAPGSLNAWPQHVWAKFVSSYKIVYSVRVQPKFIVNRIVVYELSSLSG